MTQRKEVNVEAYVKKSQEGPCFICELLAGRKPHHIVYQDDHVVAFLNRYPTQRGYALVAPVQHKEHVTGDFSPDEYQEIQAVIHRVSEAIRKTVPTERLYLMSLGSQQGNRHVHWHIVPLPPGVPYHEQQTAAISFDRGVLDIPDSEMSALAKEIRSNL